MHTKQPKRVSEQDKKERRGYDVRTKEAMREMGGESGWSDGEVGYEEKWNCRDWRVRESPEASVRDRRA